MDPGVALSDYLRLYLHKVSNGTNPGPTLRAPSRSNRKSLTGQKPPVRAIRETDSQGQPQPTRCLHCSAALPDLLLVLLLVVVVVFMAIVRCRGGGTAVGGAVMLCRIPPCCGTGAPDPVCGAIQPSEGSPESLAMAGREPDTSLRFVVIGVARSRTAARRAESPLRSGAPVMAESLAPCFPLRAFRTN